MPEKRLKRPRDPIQLGKLIVGIATGQVEDCAPSQEETPGVKLAKEGGKRAPRSCPLSVAMKSRNRLRKRDGEIPIDRC